MASTLVPAHVALCKVCSDCYILLEIRDVPDIRYYPVSGQESCIRLDQVSCIWYKTISGILYPVESHIRYYLVPYQLMQNTAANDFYGI